MFRRYLEIILKISVRLTLKELTCELSSCFDINSDFEKGGVLFLQTAFMFEMRKKNESKGKHHDWSFSTNKKNVRFNSYDECL